jgi:hypothetical protein
MELNLFELFGAARSQKKANRYQKRGSSAIWNDDKEFLTPTPNCTGKQHVLIPNDENIKVTSFEEVL